MSPFCINCGSEIEDSWNACPNCGKVLKEKTINQPQPSPRVQMQPQPQQVQPYQQQYRQLGGYRKYIWCYCISMWNNWFVLWWYCFGDYCAYIGRSWIK